MKLEADLSYYFQVVAQQQNLSVMAFKVCQSTPFALLALSKHRQVHPEAATSVRILSLRTPSARPCDGIGTCRLQTHSLSSLDCAVIRSVQSRHASRPLFTSVFFTVTRALPLHISAWARYS